MLILNKNCSETPLKILFQQHRPRTGLYGERSFDRLVGTGEQRRWDRQSERLGGLEIDHQLELGRLFDRKVARPSAFENPIDVVGYAPSLHPHHHLTFEAGFIAISSI